MAWALVNSWTYSGAVAQVDFTGLAAYSDIRVLVRNVSVSISGQRSCRVSIDNGSTFLTTSGDYVTISTVGAETAGTQMSLHGTGATAVRTAEIEICGFNLAGAPKVAHLQTRTDFRTTVITTTSALNALRIHDTGGGNLTAGSIYVYAR